MSIGTGVVVAVAFQQVDSSPDAETGTQCDDEGLKNGYCAVEKCHKCVPPCTMRPYGLVNSECPPACAPAKGQKNSRVSNFNQKPGYVKRAAHRRPHQNSNLVCLLFNQKVQKAAAPESCRSVPRRRQPSAVLSPIRCKTLLDGGRRRTKNLYGVFKRTVPAGQVRQ